MRRFVLAAALVLATAAPAFATWSIIAVDTKTGQVDHRVRDLRARRPVFRSGSRIRRAI